MIACSFSDALGSCQDGLAHVSRTSPCIQLFVLGMNKIAVCETDLYGTKYSVPQILLGPFLNTLFHIIMVSRE